MPILAAVVRAGRGTLASSAGGDRELPSNRTGPFRELTYEERGDRQCAAVDFYGLIDEPSAVILLDERIAIYATRVHDGVNAIARTVMRNPEHQEASPDVCALPGGGFAMAFATANGAIGITQSAEGITCQSLPTPALTGDPSAAVARFGEGSVL